MALARRVEGVALTAMSILALLGVAGGVGGGVSERLDLLNHFTPFYLFAGALLIVLALYRRRRGLLALGLVAVAATAPVVLGQMDWQGARSGGEPHVTVLTQNVWNDNPDPELTAAVLANTGADVIVLQEVAGSGKTVNALLKRKYPYAADCTINQWCTLSILSRWPIVAWSYHEGGWKAPKWDRLLLDRATIVGPGLDNSRWSPASWFTLTPPGIFSARKETAW